MANSQNDLLLVWLLQRIEKLFVKAVPGKQLSDENFTKEEKEKLAALSVTEHEIYSGAYSVVPSVNEQTLETATKLMTDNVTVTEIPMYSVSNISGGNTVYIGTDVGVAP